MIMIIIGLHYVFTFLHSPGRQKSLFLVLLLLPSHSVFSTLSLFHILTCSLSLISDLIVSILVSFLFFLAENSNCGPRLSPEAGELLKQNYVSMRNGGAEPNTPHKRSPIPITVRQLEAVVRIAESIAKMQLKPFVSAEHMKEAIRLFDVSTLTAAKTGGLSGADGFATPEEQHTLIRVEKQIKRRLPVGSQVREASMMQELMNQNIDVSIIKKVIACMVQKGELTHRSNRNYLFRAK